ncbi:MAG: glycosyltransferase family 9 protein [Pirellulaceae bacterium]|jgi:lipopolysaccharide heptosyltransferase I|nr:glycosyltransferase family 9 protein [Pirellulaceae bacterium]
MAHPNPRILIVRLSAIGDCVLTTPLLCALRRQFPHAFISWVVQSNCADVLRGHPCLDELIEVDRGFAKSPSRLWKLRRELQLRRFDVSIDPQGLFKSSVVAWLSGAPQRIGNAGALAREGSDWFNNTCLTTHSDHVVDHQLELLAPLGVRAGEVEFRLPLGDQARRTVGRFIMDRGFEQYAILNPGAAWESKVWPVEYYGQLAQRLAGDGIPCVIAWGGKKERAWAEQVVSHAGVNAVLAPATTLGEFAALAARATFFVGSDTGPLHIAAAVGTNCISLHGTTEPHKSGPYGHGHTPIQEFYQGGTTRQRRTAPNDAMRAIAVDRVYDACLRTARAKIPA